MSDNHDPYVERITLNVPFDFQEAVRQAAERTGLSISDYARLALGSQMARQRIPFRPIPTLHKPTPAPRARIREKA